MVVLKYSIPANYAPGCEGVDQTSLLVMGYMRALKDHGPVIGATENRIANLSDDTQLPKEFQLEVTFAEGVDPTPITKNLQQHYRAVLLSEGSEKE